MLSNHPLLFTTDFQAGVEMPSNHPLLTGEGRGEVEIS